MLDRGTSLLLRQQTSRSGAQNKRALGRRRGGKVGGPQLPLVAPRLGVPGKDAQGTSDQSLFPRMRSGRSSAISQRSNALTDSSIRRNNAFQKLVPCLLPLRLGHISAGRRSSGESPPRPRSPRNCRSLEPPTAGTWLEYGALVVLLFRQCMRRGGHHVKRVHRDRMMWSVASCRSD